MDAVLQVTNAKIERMTWRRQKKALAKRPATVLRNAYPVSAGELIGTLDSPIVTYSMSFDYTPA